jgi:hypothetical protein
VQQVTSAHSKELNSLPASSRCEQQQGRQAPPSRCPSSHASKALPLSLPPACFSTNNRTAPLTVRTAAPSGRKAAFGCTCCRWWYLRQEGAGGGCEVGNQVRQQESNPPPLGQQPRKRLAACAGRQGMDTGAWQVAAAQQRRPAALTQHHVVLSGEGLQRGRGAEHRGEASAP